MAREPAVADNSSESPPTPTSGPEPTPVPGRVTEPVRSRRRRLWWMTLLLLVGIPAGFGAHFGYVAWLRADCKEALRSKEWTRLDHRSQQWLRWQPGRAEPLLYAAQAAAESQRLDEAVRLLEQLPDTDARTPEALVECGAMLFGPLNRPLDAARVYERALRLNPTLTDAHRRLVFFYAYSLQRQEMMEQIQQALEWDCDMPETYVYLILQGALSFSNADAENLKWLQNSPDEETFLVARALYRTVSRGLLDSAEAQAVQGEKPGDIPYHEQVLAQHFARFPKNIELRCHYLRHATNDGDVDRVRELLEGCPAEAQGDARYWRYTAWLHEADGKMGEAEAALRKSLELDAYEPQTYHQMAALMRLTNRPGEVQRWEDLAIASRKLRREILQLPNVQLIPRTILHRMVNHMANVGQTEVAAKLARRIELMDRLQ